MTDYVEVDRDDVVSILAKRKTVIYAAIPDLKMGVLNCLGLGEIENMVKRDNVVFFIKKEK